MKISHLYDGCEDKFSIFTMEFTETNQGKDMLIDGGYLYVYKQPLAGNRHSWECRVHRKKLCKALVTVLDYAIVGVHDHTHAPNATQIEVAKFRASIKRKALTTHDTPQEILTTELANVSNEAEEGHVIYRCFPFKYGICTTAHLLYFQELITMLKGGKKRFQTTCGCAHPNI